MQHRMSVVTAMVLAGTAAAYPAHATPLPNSAVIHTRVFNDCPVSILNTTNVFPGLIEINDQNQVAPFCAGFANLHTWRFSVDGVNALQFLNGDGFEYSCTLTLNGVGEGGLNLSPWFSPDADGLFNVRTTDGEIACFGGRMPFFTFTGAFGLHYVNNTPIQLGISYIPNGLSSASPAQIVYNVRYQGTNYTSGLINFDEGNTAEDPPHGLWGALTPWYAGGHVKMFVQTIGQPHGIDAKWNDIQYAVTTVSAPPVIACPGNVQLECGKSTDPSNTGSATATGGNCTGGATIGHTDAATAASCTGVAGIDRTWTATDACGHSVSCVQHITFVDHEAPVITASGTPADGVLGCNPTTAQIEAALGTATAKDNCGDVTPAPSDGDVTEDGCKRSQTRTWTVSDACSNAETPVSRTVTWTVNTQTPVITATGTPADGVLGCNPTAAQIEAALGTATATADCGDVTPTSSDADVVSSGCTRSQTRTWTASACGNPATPVSRTATWSVDTQAPTISGVSASPTSLWPPDHTLRDVTISYSADDNCSGAVTTSLSVASNEPINGIGDGDTAPDWEIVDNHHLRLRAERAGTGNGRIYTVTITATDACGKSSTKTVTVVVAHNIAGPASGTAFKINTPVNFAGTFWDVPGTRHTAQWAFDNSATTGTVTEPAGIKPGSVAGKYTFTAPGVYKVTLNLTDQNGLKSWVNTAGDLEAIVVAYDPSAGYAIGGGWFVSPTGALRANPTATGKASFGFTSKYFKNAVNPKGETQFEFKLGGLEFNALNYDYLAISGARAQFKGFGKINDDASYNFILTVVDGQLSGGGGTDRIRMKIWNKTTGAVVYDSQMGASDSADPKLAVGNGSSIAIVATSATAPTLISAAAGESNPAPSGMPAAFALTAIRPNPFSRSAEIQYTLPSPARVEMTLYSITGQRVREIVNGDEPAGHRMVRVDGRGLTPGIYLVRMRASANDDPGRHFTQVRKVVLE